MVGADEAERDATLPPPLPDKRSSTCAAENASKSDERLVLGRDAKGPPCKAINGARGAAADTEVEDKEGGGGGKPGCPMLGPDAVAENAAEAEAAAGRVDAPALPETAWRAGSRCGSNMS